jgi:hypothetical protein
MPIARSRHEAGKASSDQHDPGLDPVATCLDGDGESGGLIPDDFSLSANLVVEGLHDPCADVGDQGGKGQDKGGLHRRRQLGNQQHRHDQDEQ